MTPDARIAAAIDILDAWLSGRNVEQTLTSWARRNRFAGSGDRAAIRDLVYDALRCKRSFAWSGGAETGRGLMLGRAHATGDDLDRLFTGQGYGPAALSVAERVKRVSSEAPDAVRLDCPDWLWPEMERSLGACVEQVLSQMQSRAPVFLRANLAKGTRDEAIAALATEDIDGRSHPLSKTAIEVVANPRRVRSSKPYVSGRVEIQDAASQAVIDVFEEHCPSGEVLDYCAGGGGKSLALAAFGTYAVTAHDADPNRMKDLPDRANRAGAKIAVTLTQKRMFDAVLCDAPCSGSGAWRRQPEAKWTLTDERLRELNKTQDDILNEAAQKTKPGGLLAYATCSLLERENADRIESFLDKNAGWTQKFQKKFTPLDGGDGFFIAGLTSAI